MEQLLLQREIDRWVHGWRIPDDVNTYPMGGILPQGGGIADGAESAGNAGSIGAGGGNLNGFGQSGVGGSGFGRTAARTWHTLIVRSRPRAVVLLETVPLDPGDDREAIVVSETDAHRVPFDGILGEQLARSPVGVTPQLAFPKNSATPLQLRLLHSLAPGCPVLPILLNANVADPDDSSGHAFGERLGHELLLDPDVLIVAISDLTRYGEGYGFTPGGLGDGGHKWLRQNDARMIRYLRELASEEVQGEARQNRNASGGHALAAALAAAKVRGSSVGHLLEYTTSHQACQESDIFSQGVGYVGVVF